MKKTIYISAILAALLFSACRSKDAEVNAFIDDLNRLTADVTSTFRADPSVAGIEAAQKKLDAKRDELKRRRGRLKDVSGDRVSDAAARNLTDAIDRNIQSVARMQTDNAGKVFAEQEFGEKMMRLVSDYNSIFGG